MPKRPRSSDVAEEPCQSAGSSSGVTNQSAGSTSGVTNQSALHAVAAAFSGVDSYAIAREEKRAQRSAGIFLEGIQFGEIDATSFSVALEWVSPKPGETFVDLGSGAGKAVLTAAALHDLASATGVEILRPLHDAAVAAAARCDVGRTRVELLCADALAHPWQSCDLVFCTTTCFSDEMCARLEAGVHELRVGARLIVTTRPLRAEGVKLLRKGKLPYAKGSLLFFAYERV
jgi:protein-L-isoaspartate O-methyltransferase